MDKNKEFFKFKPIRATGFWKVINDESWKVRVFAISGEYEFDSVAGIIWLLCDGMTSVSTMIHKIQKMYPGTDPERIEEDIIKFLISIEKHDLIILDYNPLFPHKKINFLQKEEAYEP